MPLANPKNQKGQAGLDKKGSLILLNPSEFSWKIPYFLFVVLGHPLSGLASVTHYPESSTPRILWPAA
jgi:hypothetical protein